ncbi:MAG TPA: hypothetical protein VMX17_14800 [Candidatus Glassbacteria bacterium]|nr:hypothetical protein [Candidatus Glassbacteria bacterium]
MEGFSDKIDKAIGPIIQQYSPVNSGGISQATADANLEIIRRTNRRRQAWVALLSIIVITLLLMFCVSEIMIKTLEPILPFFYITMGSIVAAYHGFSAWLGIKK